MYVLLGKESVPVYELEHIAIIPVYGSLHENTHTHKHTVHENNRYCTKHFFKNK